MAKQERKIKVSNRSDGNAVYHIQELNIRRVFTPNEEKEVTEQELNYLYQMDGGAMLLKHYLVVQDRDWVNARWDAPEEYFWTLEEIKNCVINDSLELFAETLDYAPQGVLDVIKQFAWRLPLTDLNKVNVLKEKLGFDSQKAASAMQTTISVSATPKRERLRQRKEA